MTDLTAGDVAAMRAQGDFRAFLRTVTGAKPATPPTTPTIPERDPGNIPGTWPTGTRPPGPATPTATPAAWQQALGEYRDWDRAGRPQGNHTCDCGACRTRPQEGTPS